MKVAAPAVLQQARAAAVVLALIPKSSAATVMAVARVPTEAVVPVAAPPVKHTRKTDMVRVKIWLDKK